MFLDFYRLREQPFGDSPDPQFIYLSPTHREALAGLLCGIEMDRSFLALISEPGLGKTTLLHELLERLRHSARALFLFQNSCVSLDLFRSLIHSVGGEASGLGMGGLLAKLYDILGQEAQTGKRLVLVIDEAQSFEEPTLETIRLLSNLEATGTARIHVILSGQPLLEEKLASPGLLQLRQRISILSRLAPLDEPEVARYIEHRLAVAGHSGNPLFTQDAVEAIAVASQGIPRVINNLCTNALLLGYAQQRNQIDTRIVEEAASDLGLTCLAPTRREGRQPVTGTILAPQFLDPSEAKWAFLQKSLGRVALAAVLILAVLLYSSRSSSSAKAPQGAPVAASPASTVPSTSTVPIPSGAESNAASSLPELQRATQDDSSLPEKSPRTFTVVVGPKQTLRQICLRNVGRFDGRLVTEIQQLNPWMDDPNQLEIGQQILLPRPAVAPKRVPHTTELQARDKAGEMP